MRVQRSRLPILLVAGLCALATALGCGDDAAMQPVYWSLRGLTAGSATLTETVSGRSWTLPRGIPISGSGGARVSGFVLFADLTHQWLEVEIPRRGDQWHFELETSDTGSIICNIDNEPSGRFSELWSDEATIHVHVVCGSPLDEIELDDPGLEDCLAELPNPPAHTGYLHSLDCSDRGITTLGGLSQLWALSDIDLSGNLLVLDQTDVSELRSLWQLGTLDLSHNRIERVFAEAEPGSHIDSGRLIPLPYEMLDLSHNRITSFVIVGSGGVSRLLLDHNLIEEFEVAQPWDYELPEEDEPIIVPLVFFGGSTASFTLRGYRDLDESEFRDTILIPAVQGYIPAEPETHVFHVEDLDVSFNRLTQLDLSAAGYGLRQIDASHNDLGTVILRRAPHEVLVPPPLFLVDVSFNQLADASQSGPETGLVLGDEGVRRLDLSNNDLTSLDPSLVSPVTVEVWARANWIDDVDLSEASALVSLDLAENDLASVDLGAATALTELDLSDNVLDDFPWSGGAEWLETLDLSGNPLGQLDECMAASLWRLRLEDSGVTTLDASGCGQLEWIELAGSALGALDVSANPLLDHVDLRETPITCEAVTAVIADVPLAEVLRDEGLCGP